MKLSKTNLIKITSITASLAAIVTMMGFGCGLGFQPYGSLQLPSVGPGLTGGENGDLSIVPGAKTVAVTNYTSVLDNMVSMAGVTPSNNTTNIFQDKLGSFSEKGDATSINAPMLMAYVAVGAEVCNDLLTQEQNAGANRRFFPEGMNLAGNGTANATNAFSNAVISDVTRRFARQFWQRNETDEEGAMIRAGVREMLAASNSQTAAGLTRRAGLYICTAAIASTSSYQL